ncbi:MAG: glycerophosphodiester phosphodiesterase family protein [Bacillota bacterium]
MLELIGISLLIIFILNILQFLKARFFQAPGPPHSFFRLLRKPVNIGHRGASGVRPENTMSSFKLALEQGAVGLEFDLRLTQDKKVVVFHDEDLERLAGRPERIAELTLTELKEVSLRDEEKIVTLREVLHEFPDIPLIIELKDKGEDLAAAAAQVVIEEEAQAQVLFGCFDITTIKILRRLLPEVPTAAAEKEGMKFYLFALLGLAGFMEWPFAGFVTPLYRGRIPVLTLFFRTAVKARGMLLLVWTVNEKTEMRELLKQDVDGILTDYPEIMSSLLKKH